MVRRSTRIPLLQKKKKEEEKERKKHEAAKAKELEKKKKERAKRKRTATAPKKKKVQKVDLTESESEPEPVISKKPLKDCSRHYETFPIEDTEMASKKGVICREGWTAGLVSKLLGSPDEYAENPHYASAAPMCLYYVQRVREAEKSELFQQTLLRKKARANKVKTALKTGLKIKTPSMGMSEKIRNTKALVEMARNGQEKAFMNKLEAVGGDKGISVDYPISKGNSTLLHSSVFGGNANITSVLLELGADVMKVNKGGSTALHYACENGKTNVALVLVRNGGDRAMNVRNGQGFTPLGWAKSNGHTATVKAIQKELNLDEEAMESILRPFCPKPYKAPPPRRRRWYDHDRYGYDRYERYGYDYDDRYGYSSDY